MKTVGNRIKRWYVGVSEIKEESVGKHKKRRAATALMELRRRDKLRELDLDASIPTASKGELPGWLKKVAREKLPTTLAWIDLEALPPLYSMRGERLCVEGSVGVIRLLQRHSREQMRIIDEHGEYIHPTSLARLVEHLIEMYASDPNVIGHQWAIGAHRHFHDRASFEHLTEALLRGRIERVEKQQALLSTFRDNGEVGEALLHALCFLRGYDSLRAVILTVLPSINESRSRYRWYFDEEDVKPIDFAEHARIVSALGFDDFGARAFEIDGEVRWVRLDWLEERDHEAMITRLWGDALQETPEAAEHDSDQVERSGERSLFTVAMIFGVLLDRGAEILERMMTQRTCWSRAVWYETFIDQVFMRMWSSRIVWGVYEGRHLIETFRVCEDLTLADYQDEAYEIPRGRRIGIVPHQDLTPETRHVWSERLASYELISPINQFEPDRAS